MADYQRIKGARLRHPTYTGRLYVAEPGGQPRTVDPEDWRLRHDAARDLCLVPDDHAPEDVPLVLDAWLTHAGHGGPLTRKSVGTNAWLVRTLSGFRVILHDTPIVEYTRAWGESDSEWLVTLRADGWGTPLTSLWMERFLPWTWRIHKFGSKKAWRIMTHPYGWYHPEDECTDLGEVREGATWRLLTGGMVREGGDPVTSTPRAQPHGQSWQSRVYGSPLASYR